MRNSKNLKVFALIFFLSLLLVTAAFASVKAASQGTLTMLVSAGGSTDPAPGTTSYDDGTVVSITATAGTGFVFSNWQVVTAAGGTETTDNPLELTIAGGTDYVIQPIFIAEQTPTGPVTDYTTAAIVVVLASVGGTTTPAAGTYALASATSLDLTAHADSGFVFDHWVIGGVTGTIGSNPHGGFAFTDTPTNNPYNVNHGYGATYSYQAVFKPSGSTTSPTVPEFSGIAAIGVAIALVASAFVTIAIKRRTK